MQDEEDAKRGMYNWFAQCQTLLTPTRLALATAFTSAVAFALMPPLQALFALAMCTAVVIAAYQYGKAMIGGVVGDFLGASIAVSEVLLYLMLAADTSKARHSLPAVHKWRCQTVHTRHQLAEADAADELRESVSEGR